MGPLIPRIAALLVAIVLLACSNHVQPLSGSWRGVYKNSGLTVFVRMEIDSGSQVRVSAPNAIGDFMAIP